MIEVYCVKINEYLEKSIFDYFMSYLPEDKQKRIKKYSKIEDTQRTLIADVLIRTLICCKLDIDNKDIFFDTNEYGKPFLIGFNNFYFNISHSGDWVVCAINNLPIGIDIEHIHIIDFNIAKEFFSKEEYHTLINLDISQRLSYFYQLWTLKESYIKALGKGVSIPLDSFSFKIINSNIIFKTETEFRKCYFKQYNIDINYKMAVCAYESFFPKKVIEKSVNDICFMLKNKI